MKNKRVFLLIAAVAVMGLFSGCPDTPETTGGDNVTVKFNTDGGEPETIPSITLKKGESMGNQYPSDPTLEDHYFGGWYSGDTLYTADTPINASITLRASWIHESEASFFTVTFNSAGGSLVTSVRVIQNTSMGSKYPIPTYPEALKEFAGWWLNPDTPNEQEITARTLIERNITVRAKWNDIPVTVSFNTDGGSPASINPITLNKGDTLGAQFPANPAKNGHLFRGWFAADDAEYADIYLAATRIMENVTLKARWLNMDGITLRTITFNRNNTDTEGFTEAVPATLGVPDGTQIVTLPEPPTRSYGWSVGMVFDGWYTAPDGGTAVTAATVVNADMEVFAQWKFQPGTPQLLGETLVHIGPEMTNNAGDGGTQGTWNGSISDVDGSATYSGGAVRYAFPSNIADYDFFTLELIARNTASGTMGNNIFKRFNTGEDYMPRAGSQYPSLTSNTPASFEFEIRGANNTGGIAIQNNNGGERTIKWVKVTFTKGERVQITFDPGAGAEPVAPITTAVIGTTIGNLPVPQRSGYNFAGWEDAGGNLVSATTPVTGAMTLTARWNEAVTVTPITVDFTAASVTAASGTITNVTAAGFQHTYSSSAQYRQAWAKFSVTLPAGAPLSSYGSVTVTIQGRGGDNANKNVFLLAGTPLPGSFSADPNSLTSQYNVGSNNPGVGTGTSTVTINIDNSLSATTTGTVQFCFYIHCAHESGATSWEFRDVTLNVR